MWLYRASFERIRIIRYFIFIIILMTVVYLIPDYMRALKCTQTAYATVMDVEYNYLGKQVSSYNYTFCMWNGASVRKFKISNCHSMFPIGHVVLVAYSNDGVIYRIPNGLY